MVVTFRRGSTAAALYRLVFVESAATIAGLETERNMPSDSAGGGVTEVIWTLGLPGPARGVTGIAEADTEGDRAGRALSTRVTCKSPATRFCVNSGGGEVAF